MYSLIFKAIATGKATKLFFYLKTRVQLTPDAFVLVMSLSIPQVLTYMPAFVLLENGCSSPDADIYLKKNALQKVGNSFFGKGLDGLTKIKRKINNLLECLERLQGTRARATRT